jgi:hypothetical protein
MLLASVLFLVLVLAIGGVLVAGARAASRRAGLPPSEARAVTSRAALAIAGWLGVLAALAGLGVFTDFDARPPRLLLVVGAAILLFVTLSRTPLFKRLLAAAPRSWPIAIQTMRIPIELALWALCLLGRIPVHLTLDGRNVDILVGLTAPIGAFALHRGWIGTRGAVLWNLASLAALTNIVVMAVTSIPGPLHLDWPGVPNTVVAEFPYVWLPGFLVPLALFGHISSLRQLLTFSPHSSESRSSNPSTPRRAAS